MAQGDYDVEVEFMDGEKRIYPKVQCTREEGCLVIRTSEYYGASPVVKYIVPLVNIRQVQYK